MPGLSERCASSTWDLVGSSRQVHLNSADGMGGWEGREKRVTDIRDREESKGGGKERRGTLSD